ncbi:MAG: hypothetical protein ABI867_00615 [Kofleriaceae bacterium]
MTDSRLADDEARRAIQHESIKASVESDVQGEIAERASVPRSAEEARLQQAAGSIRENAVDEVIDTEREGQRSRGIARVSQFIDYAFFLVYILLAFRFVLALIGANTGAGFVKFIASISDPLYAPFKNIVGTSKIGEGHGYVLGSALVALGAYVVLHFAINRLLRVFVVRKTAV